MVKEGILKQNFRIKCSYERLTEYINDKILKAIKDYVNNPELWVDDSDPEVVFKGTYNTNYHAEWYDATRECPAEYQIDRDYLSDGKNEWLLCYLPEELRKLIDVIEIEEKEDETEEV
jgi:hypothetical protein